MQRPSNFRYLNRDHEWLGFQLAGLEVTADGAIELMSRPTLQDSLPAGVETLPIPDGPSGVAVLRDRSVWFTDPGGDAIYVSSGCDGTIARVQCAFATGATNAPSRPRGIAALPAKHAIAVADSGNHRLLLFDDQSLELREVWGARAPSGAPQASAEPGSFDTPWSLCADQTGHVYVLDYGNRRIQRFDRAGTPDAEFASRYAASGLVSRPGGLALLDGEEARLFVLDLDSNTIWLFDTSGSPVLDSGGRPVAIRSAELKKPMALAVDDRTLYVGDNGLKSIAVFRAGKMGASAPPTVYEFVGLASGYSAPVGALAVDAKHRLLAHAGGPQAPVALSPGGAYAESGVFWSQAIDAEGASVRWDRVAATFGPRSAGHVTFYWATGKSTQAPRVDTDPQASNPFADAAWHPVPGGAPVFRVTSPAAPFLFVGARFTGNHAETPSLQQLRADFASDRCLPRLPAIYREAALEQDYLARWLALQQSFIDDVDDEIARLPAVFDPYGAPEDGLDWLATFLAVDVDPDASVERRRGAIARAYERYRWRGTVRGLLLALEDELGLRARVMEPIFAGSFWMLPAPNQCEGGQALPGWADASASMVGVSTRLIPMEPDGAVLDVSSTLDQSRIATVESGAPLFETVAHQFVVQVFAEAALAPERLARITGVIEKHAPAHTCFRVEVVGPSMRVGFQARLGIDAIVAGDAPPTRLGVDPLRLGGGSAARVGQGRLGAGIRV